MRIGPAQLPNYQELLDILAKEVVRPLPQGKEASHYGDFSTIVALLHAYDLPVKFFEDPLRFEDLKDQTFFNVISSMFTDLADAILTDHGPARQTLLSALYDYLSEEDPVEQADIIFVFGSKETFRTEKAVSLYRQNLAPRIVISGRGPAYETSTQSEAERLARYAFGQGVPESALVLEKESITLPDNVKRTLNLLEETSVPHTNIILVNSPFSQRRGWAHFNKFSVQGTKLIRQTAKIGRRFSREEWFRHEETVKIITKEFFGLRISSLLNTS